MDPTPLADVQVHSVLDHLKDSGIATAIGLFPTIIIDQDLLLHHLPGDPQLFLPCLDPGPVVHLVDLDLFVLVHQMQDVQHPTVLQDKHKEAVETNVQVQEMEIPSVEDLHHPMQETTDLHHLDQVQVLVQEEIGPVPDSSEVIIDPHQQDPDLATEMDPRADPDPVTEMDLRADPDSVMEMDPQEDPDLVMEMDPQADPDPEMEMDPQADPDQVMEMVQLADPDQEVEMEDLDLEEVMVDDQDQVLIKIFEVEDKGPDFHQPELDPVLLPDGVPVDSVDKIPGQAEITVLVIVLQLSHVQILSVQQF